MFSKTMFLCVLLMLHCTLGFPQNDAFDPTGIAGSFLKPIKDAKQKQIMPILGLFQQPLGVFSKASHGIVKRQASDDKSSDSDSLLGSIKKAKEKHIQDIFGFFGDQLGKVSKALNVLGSPSSNNE
ncbi:uncharacterized protein LOC124535257 [Vanessa cardui]|uniref:uncharacterized protein LOC124535257 n=1 Tax=Vanessa cardui TaxID=171605 RepID=UPI001F142408|nr:uncharacterized protein LOC124535257 [Vanessa cardui]